MLCGHLALSRWILAVCDLSLMFTGCCEGVLMFGGVCEGVVMFRGALLVVSVSSCLVGYSVWVMGV